MDKISKRINHNILCIKGHYLTLQSDGLYGNEVCRNNLSLMDQLVDYLIAENKTDEGSFVKEMNQLLKDSKIEGRLCLVHL
jgi:hypothetical protein